MRIKRFLLIVLSLLATCVLCVACGETDKPSSPSKPTAVAADRNIALDLYGVSSATVNIGEHINENGLTVTYGVTVGDDTIVTASEITDRKFTVTALKTGTTKITLNAFVGENKGVSVEFDVAVTDTAPEPPELTQEKYSYDKAVGLDFELPVKLNGAEISMLKIDGTRLVEDLWSYSETTECVSINEEYMLSLALGDYAAELITTGGTAEFTLAVVNTVETSFDKVTSRSAELGKAHGVTFSADFGEATVKSITYGDYTLSSDDYTATATSLTVNESFYKRTFGEGKYTLTLSNNDIYEFYIETNNLAYTDYDVTTLHSDLQSNTGLNPYYQDSTRVEIIEAPDDCGMSGKVLKFTPHTEDVPLSVHGIYTFEETGGTGTWHKLAFKSGKNYIVSFDYYPVDTTDGEDVRFRTYAGNLMGPKLDMTPGELKHYSYSFTYRPEYAAFMVYGKLLNGGYILFDNYRITETDELLAAELESSDENGLVVSVTANGYLVSDVLIDGASVPYNYEEGKVTVAAEVVDQLELGRHTVSILTSVSCAEVVFDHADKSKIAILTETERAFKFGASEIKLAGQFDDGVTVTGLSRRGDSPFDSAKTESKPMNIEYVSLGADGLTIMKGLLDQVYGTCEYELEVSTGDTLSFSLTSNTLFYTDFDETDLWGEGIVDLYGVLREPNAVPLVSFESGVEGLEGRALKYSAPEVNNDWFIRILTFQNREAGAPWWFCPMTFEDEKFYEFSFKYKAEFETQPAHGFYYSTQPNDGEIALADQTEGVHTFSQVFKGKDIALFLIGYWGFDVTGATLYVDEFRIAETDAPAVVASLDEKSKTFVRGIDSLKLAGTFRGGVTVTELKRRGYGHFDKAFVTAQPMNVDYITVDNDGLTLSKALLDQVYGTCDYTAMFSNGSVIKFSLTSNALYYSDFDETDLWAHVVPDYGRLSELDAESMVAVEKVDGFTGNVLKYSPVASTWLIRIFTFQKGEPGGSWWHPLAIDDAKSYTVSFDYMIEYDSTPAKGFYYTTQMANGETVIADQTPGKHTFSVTLSGADIAVFALGYWFGDVADVVMYLDNFCIEEVVTA